MVHMTMLVKHECQFCKYDAAHKEPCKGCGEQHNNPAGFKSFLNAMFPNLSDRDIDPTVRAYSAHKTQPDMIHQAEHAMMSGKREGMNKKPKNWTTSKADKSCPFCKDFAALTAEHPTKIEELVDMAKEHDKNPEIYHKNVVAHMRRLNESQDNWKKETKSYILKLYDEKGCIYCRTSEVFKKRKLPTHQHLEAYRNAHHDALNSNPEFQKMSKEQKNEQLAAVEHDVKIFEIHGRKPNDVHDMIDHIKQERKIDEKNAAVMSVSSPKTGETCNCETGDHANAGGQEHGMFNQDIGRQNWQGQGLPQPKQDKDGCQCDEKPSEANKVPNADARLGDDEDKKKKAENITKYKIMGHEGQKCPFGNCGHVTGNLKDFQTHTNTKHPLGHGKGDYSFLHYPKNHPDTKRMRQTTSNPEYKRDMAGQKRSQEEKKAEEDTPDIEPVSGTSTGGGVRSPKKYSTKPNESNPTGVINPAWKKHRAAQRATRAQKKRELRAGEQIESMSPDVKLNYERNMQLNQQVKPDKKTVRNTNRKPMTQQDLKRRKTKLLGRKKKMWLQIKAILQRLKTERGDGTWGMRGLGEGEGTTDVQGSGDTHLISPVKQEELDRAMAGARYYPRSVSRKKPDIYQ